MLTALYFLFQIILCTASLQADTIDGATTASYPRDLGANSIIIGSDSTGKTTIYRHIVTNVSGLNRLMIKGGSSKLILRDSKIVLDGNYSFSQGSIDVFGNCSYDHCR